MSIFGRLRFLPIRALLLGAFVGKIEAVKTLESQNM